MSTSYSIPLDAALNTLENYLNTHIFKTPQSITSMKLEDDGSGLICEIEEKSTKRPRKSRARQRALTPVEVNHLNDVAALSGAEDHD